MAREDGGIYVGEPAIELVWLLVRIGDFRGGRSFGCLIRHTLFQGRPIEFLQIEIRKAIEFIGELGARRLEILGQRSAAQRKVARWWRGAYRSCRLR